MRNLYAYLCGVVFALGLGISQMTRPPKILGFLNILGDWDPTLLVVFATATGVYLICYKWVLGSEVTQPLEDYLKGKEKLKPRVIFGSIIFGLGWGTAGLCPGPAVTDLVTAQFPIILFVAGMLLGMYSVKKFI